MSKRFASVIARIMAIVSHMALMSCERRPLNEMNDRILLNLKVDLKVMNKIELPEPEVMRVVFYNPETGKKVTEDYLSAGGGYISVPPGEYRAIVYNFDTESTLIRNDDNINEIECYTNEISPALKSRMYSVINKSAAQIRAAAAQTKAGSDSTSTKADDMAWVKAVEDLEKSALIYEPDHLFVARQNMKILNTSGEQVFETTAESVVESYYISVNVKNIKNMASATALLTGQIASNKIGYEKEEGKTNTNVTLFFNMEAAQNEDNVNRDKIEATFNTFGKLPSSESRLWLTIAVTNTDGTTVEWHRDITAEFDNNPDHRIEIVEDTIVIPEVNNGSEGSGGGFQPGVSEWDEEHHTILL